ncbi:hypothetical protein [Microbacterium sp. P04]|uniref:hypothetical protein n=1 Tax=Microbacterium sp. P04 TaxID=3366947 RepID=UPI0037462FF0
MGFFNRLFGGDDDRAATNVPQNPASGQRVSASAYRTPDGQYTPPAPGDAPAAAGQGSSEDQAAIERYRYLLRTAPPETIEQVHAEAFSKLTDAQRQQVLADLSATLPPSERPRSDDPQAMARAATRAEYSQPGFMERTFGNRSFAGQGPGFGSMFGASVLGTIGGYVIGSALVSSFMGPGFYGDGGNGDGGEASADGGSGDGSDGSGDFGGEAASGEDSGDGGSYADGGGFGDFGGGDFGGGDFGGF